MKKKAAAINYLKEKYNIPVISALGEAGFAEKIIEEAKKNGIKIVENKDFFNYEKCFSPGQEIPEEVYKIVIDIIIFILKTNNETLTK
jgi:flagellar biosynthesis protein